MAGFREFVTGEVLTAANVDDFLAKQAVMKFADAAARDSALGTAVAGGNALREGMVAYLDDEDEVQYFDGTAWDAISQPPPGIGSNVVQAVRTTLFTTTSTSFIDITDVEVTITPTSATSKVLILFSTSSTNTTGGSTNKFELRRDSTSVGIGTDAAPSSVAAGQGSVSGVGQVALSGFPTQFMFLDSPTTTSATTYKMRIAVTAGGSARIGNVRADIPSSVPTILIAIEVAG